MNYLPTFSKIKKLFLLSFVFFSLFFTTASATLAASAYISPATGFIKEPSFLVSVYVESATTEPLIAAANIKISYPAEVNVSAVNEGEFDSYIDKSFDTTTRTITVNALNNSGNYKSGKVKLASVKFDTTANTGQVQLTIKPESSISGEGGQQLLTETINGVYTIEIESTGTGTTTTGNTTTTTTTTNNVPTTGENDFLFFLIISVALIAIGVITLAKPKFYRQ